MIEILIVLGCISLLVGLFFYFTNKKTKNEFTPGYSEMLERHREERERAEEENRKTRERGEGEGEGSIDTNTEIQQS